MKYLFFFFLIHFPPTVNCMQCAPDLNLWMSTTHLSFFLFLVGQKTSISVNWSVLCDQGTGKHLRHKECTYIYIYITFIKSLCQCLFYTHRVQKVLPLFQSLNLGIMLNTEPSNVKNANFFLVKHCVLTLVGEMHRFGNDPCYYY